MPQRRFLAPWHQPDLFEALARGEAGSAGTALDAEALAALRGKPAIYHCISRVVDRRFVLGPAEKEQFVRYMRAYEAFGQLRVLAFSVMSNHFHLLLEVPSPPERRGADWSDEEFLHHLASLYSMREVAKIRWELEHFRDLGHDSAAVALRERFLRRMWDLSAFMKSLKQRFTRWFNWQHGRKGTLWEERFKSVLVESGHAARVMAAYIDLNAVRAGMVEDPKDYRWCSYGQAVAGNQRAREGLQRVMFEGEAAGHGEGADGRPHPEAVAVLQSWRTAARRYRQALFNALHRNTSREGEDVGQTGEGATRGGELSEAEAVGTRVRHFVDGLVIGSAAFVDRTFRWTRERFGARRRDGARKIRGVATELRAMRDLAERT